MVQSDRQGLCPTEPAGAYQQVEVGPRGRREWIMSRSKQFDDNAGHEPGEAVGTTADGNLPSASDPAGVHSQTGKREKRPLGIPTVRDRVVQGAVRTCWNRSSRRNSPSTATAFAPAGAAKTPCAACGQLLKQGYMYVVDADLKSYFDTIPHDRSDERGWRGKNRDGRVLTLIERS